MIYKSVRLHCSPYILFAEDFDTLKGGAVIHSQPLSSQAIETLLQGSEEEQGVAYNMFIEEFMPEDDEVIEYEEA